MTVPVAQKTHAMTHTGPHRDRWHYMDFRDGKHDMNYIEWKYFNFTQNDLAGYIIYYLLDPELHTGLGGGRLCVRIFKNGKSAGLVKKIDINRVHIDPLTAGIVMDKASIAEKDPHDYEISCDFEDISWELTYRQKTPAIESFQNVNPGLLNWEKASWLIKMPRANVSGRIRIGRDIFNIQALGYSDTNWGELMPFFSRYEWGQFNDEKISLVFGIIFGLRSIKRSYLYFSIGTRTIRLEDASCSVNHLEWVRDQSNGLKIPSKSVFFFQKDSYIVRFTTKLMEYDSPGLQIHPLLPKSIISEQVVVYEGTIESNGQTIHSFNCKGFEEWSTRSWRKNSVLF